MKIRDLVYAATVAGEGNLTRAAKSLGVTSSTISRRLTRFEDELGLALFERGRSGIRVTPGGLAILHRARRVLAEFDAMKRCGAERSLGDAGEVRLGVRMPPVGEPLHSLLADWRQRHCNVSLTVFEMNELEIQRAIRERRIDVALLTRHTLWPDAVTAPLYRERLRAALPRGHLLAGHRTVNWSALRRETFLVQGWDTSQTAREFYASFMGCGVRFLSHPASKQSVLALVAAGFGVTLVTQSQAEVVFPGVVYRTIRDQNAWVEIELLWFPDAEDPAVGRFVAFMRDEARSRGLF